jgi:signal transduction histidine kinase
MRTAEESGWAGEVEFNRDDGSKFPAALSLRPVQDERYTRPLLAGTAHDLTEIKQREDELRLTLKRLSEARADLQALNIDLERKVEERTRQLLTTVASLERLNDQLQELDRLKSEFVTLVSHELRAPLTNISTGVEYLLRSDGLGGDTKDSLALVQQEIDRLSGFVEDILDLSALEAGRFPLDPTPLDYVQLVREVLARFSLTRDRERIVTRIPPDLPGAIGDRRATTNVIFHLIDNAIKYAPDGEICISAQDDADHVYLVVTDSGPGIPVEEQEQVFNMFHRLDNQDSKEVYGYGLGLYMARQLMLAQGGEIKVRESPAQGTEFTIGLPRSDRLVGRTGSGFGER